jgi:hypothetical protein
MSISTSASVSTGSSLKQAIEVGLDPGRHRFEGDDAGLHDMGKHPTRHVHGVCQVDRCDVDHALQAIQAHQIEALRQRAALVYRCLEADSGA